MKQPIRSIEQRMSRARTQLVMRYPWYGMLAMRLRVESTPATETFDVDGTTMRYNPEFAASLTDDELIGVLAHEVLHCAHGHVWRRGGRDGKRWNVACDAAINPILLDDGLCLPKGGVDGTPFKGNSAEAIYRMLPDMGNGGSGGGSGSGSGQDEQPCPTGTVSDPQAPQSPGKDGGSGQDSSGQGKQQGSGQPSEMSEQDWKIATEQAGMLARKAGCEPGNLSRRMRGDKPVSTDWIGETREFLAASMPTDYSFARPNRRYVHRGIYLPGQVKENIGQLVIVVDTSGSINGPVLDTFAANIKVILAEAKPEKVHVIYCDTRAGGHQVFESDDEVQLSPVGGGGTLFQPAFDWVEQAVQDGVVEDIKGLIYLTDLECGDEPQAPEYPVLWAAPVWAGGQPSFGRVVRIDADRGW